MRILDFLTHMGFQASLCRTGHAFDLAPSELWRDWDESYRPWPPNARPAPEPLAPDGYDVAIAATPAQFARIAASRVPKVLVNHMHCYPWARPFLAGLPPEVEVVYVSPHKRASYGPLGRRGRTISLAVDPEEFRGHTGEKACILNVTDAFSRREAFRGYGLFRELVRGLPVQVVGRANDDIPGAFSSRDFAHMQALYREHRCYLSPDRGGFLHLSTLEAMATGLPLVALPIPELAPHVEHGVSAFMSDDPAELRRALERLLAEPDLAREVGERGRRAVARHFPLDRFLADWNALFAELGACG